MKTFKGSATDQGALVRRCPEHAQCTMLRNAPRGLPLETVEHLYCHARYEDCYLYTLLAGSLKTERVPVQEGNAARQ